MDFEKQPSSRMNNLSVWGGIDHGAAEVI